MNIAQRIAKELHIKLEQVERTIELLDNGNTIPFIARYRKEVTGELDEEQIQTIQTRLQYLNNLESRKEEVLRLIANQNKLTPEREKEIKQAETLQLVEDLYLPFKTKRRTRATIAQEKGLEPLADILWLQELNEDPLAYAQTFVNTSLGVTTASEALQGACDILAEKVAENAKIRHIVRSLTMGRGDLYSVVQDEEKMSNYETYRDFEQAISDIPAYRILALNRAEKDKALKVKISAPEEVILTRLKKDLIRTTYAPQQNILHSMLSDAFKRLLQPSIEREIRKALTEKAELNAVKLFRTNLRNLLMQPPIKGKIILGVDPAYRTGCKLSIIDATGKFLVYKTIYPHAPQKKWDDAKQTIHELIRQYHINLIAIGNGTASRESEQLIAEIVKESAKPIAYFIVNEAGASVYSASKLARAEFPDLDVSIRGAISIARRALDPLAELVKIDPKAIGVGMYQHDVNQKNLGVALEATVESCVNAVGIDLNTASASLLNYIAGINKNIAKNIIAYRDEIGRFSSRQQLLKVSRLGKKAFEQCAGFLRIRDGKNPLDNTGVHPESYAIAHTLLDLVGAEESALVHANNDLKQALTKLNPQKVAETLNAGVPTVRDIVQELIRPGRDPREDMPQPIFHKEALTIEQLEVGMLLKGTVRNVISFGAFVDIGVKQDGLVHISELSHHFVQNPSDVVSVGDIVKVKVKDVDLKRKRIALTMKL